MHRPRDRVLARKIGTAIARARLTRDWTQEQFAEALDISTNHVGMLERGQRFPSIPMIIQIATALGLSLDELLLEKNRDRRKAGSEAAQLAAALPDDLRPLAMAFLRAGANSVPRAPASRARRSPTPG